MKMNPLDPAALPMPAASPNGGVPPESIDEIEADHGNGGTTTRRPDGVVGGLAMIPGGAGTPSFKVSGRRGAEATTGEKRDAIAKEHGDADDSAGEGQLSKFTGRMLPGGRFMPWRKARDVAATLLNMRITGDEDPARFTAAADRLADQFGAGEFTGWDRAEAYECLIYYAHGSLRREQGNPGDYVKAFTAIAALTQYLRTDAHATQSRYLGYLFEDERIPAGNVGVAAKVAFEALNDSSEPGRRGIFELAMYRVSILEPGEREPTLMAITENLDKCPKFQGVECFLLKLDRLSQQESPSCQAQVAEAIENYTGASLEELRLRSPGSS